MTLQLVQMIEQLQKCEKAGATMACVLQVYVFIDALAFVGMPVNQTVNTRTDFMAWVDRYLKADATQAYQYRGLDVYGARCATLHMFGAESDFHQKNPTAIMFGYTDGGRHFYDANVQPRLAIIGTASLITDFVGAIGAFAEDLKPRVAIATEKAVLDARLAKVHANLPFPSATK